MIITIDGPTASGKSSVARLIAQQLAMYYLNTGLLYRALAYGLIHTNNCTIEQLTNPDSERIQAVLDSIEYIYHNNTATIFFNNVDITALLKTANIDKAASLISAVPLVRSLLLEYQRTFAATRELVVDGRDCGSVVFPHAEYKFFLTATPAIRAKRWQQDMAAKGKQFSLEESLQQILERDKRDQEREIAPLIVPEHAIVIDNSSMTLQQTIDEMINHIENK